MNGGLIGLVGDGGYLWMVVTLPAAVDANPGIT
jgi:hypothetical protein